MIRLPGGEIDPDNRIVRVFTMGSVPSEFALRADGTRWRVISQPQTWFDVAEEGGAFALGENSGGLGLTIGHFWVNGHKQAGLDPRTPDQRFAP